MKPPRILATSITALLTGAFAQAATYIWDTASGDGTTITAGSGSWDVAASNLAWNSGGTNVPWAQTSATAPLHSAVFGGADGAYTVTLGAPIATQGLTFNNSGYTLTAATPLTLTTTAPVTVAAGKSATIGSNVTLARSGAHIVAGGGRLVISGAMTASTGASEIRDGSTLEVASGGSVTFNGSPVIGSNTAPVISQDGNLLVSGGTVTTNGGTTNFVIGNMNAGTTNAMVTINAGAITIGSNSPDGIRFGSNAPSGGTINSTFHLDGGVVTTPGVRRYTPGGTSVINATFNFNGGTLKANRATPNSGTSTVFFDPGINASVKAGGAKIDSNGFNLTFASPLLDGGGGGGLEKLGVGTLTLTGNNTYTGTTTISAGTLQIGSGGANGMLGSGAVVNNGALIFNRSGALNIANGISGAGSVALNGNATYTLGGVNSYTGATTISGPTRVDLTGTFTSDISVATGTNVGGEGSTSGALSFGGTHTLFFDPATTAHLTANTIDASAATITLNPTSGVAGQGIIVLEAPGGIAGSVHSMTGNFRFSGRGSAYFNGNNTQLLFDSAPTVLKWAGNSASPTAWDVQTTQNWRNGGTPDVFFTGDAVTFDDTATSYAVDIQAPSVAPGSVTFDNTTAYTITGGAIAGSGALVKNGAGTVILANDNTYTGTTTINAGKIQLGDGLNGTGSFGTGPVNNNAAIVTEFGVNNVTIASSIGGAGTLTQSGSGTVSLTGTNNYSGTTTISAGTLSVGSGGTSGTLGTGAVVNDSTLAFNRLDNVTVSNAISGTGNVTKLGVGILTLGVANSYSGITTISGGAILVNASSGILGSTAGGTVVTSTGAAVQLQGGITVSGEALTLTGEGVNGVTAPGALRNLSGDNEWAGPIAVEPTTSGVTIHRIVSETGNLKISGDITLGPDFGDQFVLQGNGSGEVSGAISGPMRLTRSVAGTGIWTLSGANTYAGKTIVSNSFLRVSSLNSVVGGMANSSLGTPTTVANGTIDLGGVSGAGTTGGLIYTGTGESTDRVINLASASNGNAILDQSGTGVLLFTSNFSSVASSSAKTLTLQGSTSGAGEIAGAIANGTSTAGGAPLANSVVKAGSGTWTLSGPNSYTGATNVTAGTLAISASGSITGSTAIAVSGGATFDVSALAGGFFLSGPQTLSGGSETTAGLVSGSVIAGAGSTVAPGLAIGTTGRLSLSGGFSLESTAHLSLDLNGTVAGAGYDQVVVTGGNITLAGDLDGSTLGFTPTAFQDIFYVILNNGSGSTSGTLGGIAEGGSFFIGAQEFRVSYTSDSGGTGFTIGGMGNDVALQAVPEPASALSLLAGCGVLLGLRRRRSK